MHVYPNEDYDYWHEEIVANTVPVILTDKQTVLEFAERIAAEDKETQTLFLQMLNAIKKILTNAYNILKDEKSWQQMKVIKADLNALQDIREAYLKELEEVKDEAIQGGEVKMSAARLNPDFASKVDVEENMKKVAEMAPVKELTGRKDVLGMWIGEHDSSKFWLVVLNELKNRGVQDILICSIDNLKGFSEAISACYSEAEIQKCVVHQIRNSVKICFLQGREKSAVRFEAGIHGSIRASGPGSLKRL